MFKKNKQPQRSQPSPSPSMDSMPSFIRSPVVPRFNSLFPPLHPDKRYRGVYERAGFDVYKGNYNNHKHSHDVNHPSECNSMGTNSVRNSPSPSGNKKFSRNFTAPNPFAKNNNHKSDPYLTNNSSKSTRSLDNNNTTQRRNFSESTIPSGATSPYKQRPQLPELTKSTSSNNFNYVSAYSTPVVDSNVGKNEDIRTNNYTTPIRENFGTNRQILETQKLDLNDNNDIHLSSPEKSFHSLENLPLESSDIGNGSDYHAYNDNNYEPYPHSGMMESHQNQNQNQNQTQQTNDYGLNIRDRDTFNFGHDSITSTYPNEHGFEEAPRLSQLIEEEIGATPRIQMPTGDFEGEFYDAVPSFNNDMAPSYNNERVMTTPQIIVEENYDHKYLENIDKSDDEEEQQDVESDNDVEVGQAVDNKATMSTYMTRNLTYDLLTGGDIPSKTPNFPSGPQLQSKHLTDGTRGYSTGPEDDFDNFTDPLTATTATSTNSYDYSTGDYSIDNEIESLTKNLGGGHLYDTNITPEIKQELEGKFVHHKILTPAIDFEENTKPLDVSHKSTAADREKPHVELQSQSMQQPPEKKYPPGSGPCRRCGLEITGKSIWSKDEQLSGQWHRGCFGCHTCAAPFIKGTNCYVINDYPYCEQHFHELNNSLCKTCGSGIEGTCLENEQSEKFHPHCLSCHKCGLFIDKDYFIVDGLPLCESDGLIEIEKEKNLLMNGGGGVRGGLSPNSRIEKRRTRLLQI